MKESKGLLSILKVSCSNREESVDYQLMIVQQEHEAININ